MAADNFGRLRRAWTEAVFLWRRMAKELSDPFAQEAGVEEYLDELIEVSHESEHAVEEKFYERTVALTSPFRAPSYAPPHRRAQDVARTRSRSSSRTSFDGTRSRVRRVRCTSIWTRCPSTVSC